MADDDARDERLGRLLEVEPLDELTRRRLVTKAMRASAPPARSRLVAAAAVVAIVVAGGIGYLALRGNDSTAPSASPVQPAATAAGGSSSSKAAPITGGASESNNNGAETTAPTAAGAVAAPRDLGDFGDLDDATNVGRLRASTGSSFSASTQGQSGTQDKTASDGASLVAQLRALSCADELPDGTILAIGTGHFGTRDAIVVETSLPDGTTSLDAVVAQPCKVRPLD